MEVMVMVVMDALLKPHPRLLPLPLPKLPPKLLQKHLLATAMEVVTEDMEATEVTEDTLATEATEVTVDMVDMAITAKHSDNQRKLI